MRIDQQVVAQQIANLKLLYPAVFEDDEAWLASLESETDVYELLDKLAGEVKDANAFAGAIGGIIAEYELRQERYERKSEAARALIEKFMNIADLPKVTRPAATMYFAKGQPKVIGDPDPDTLPDDLCRIKREPNMSAIKAKLAFGETVSGCELSNAAPHLVLRWK